MEPHWGCPWARLSLSLADGANDSMDFNARAKHRWMGTLHRTDPFAVPGRCFMVLGGAGGGWEHIEHSGIGPGWMSYPGSV